MCASLRFHTHLCALGAERTTRSCEWQVIHGSGVNRSANPRRALSISYMDAQTRFSREAFEAEVGGTNGSSGYPEGGADFPLIFAADVDADQ